jgi:GNAT superfamily N-acetyltransferase
VPTTTSAVSVQSALEEDLPRAVGDLRHALATDPDGLFAARDGSGAVLGLAAGAVRGDVLLILHLDVAQRARGRGIGRALHAAVGAYGAARGAHQLEFLRPAEAETLGFLLSTGLPVRSVALKLRVTLRRPEAAPSPGGELVPVGPGAPLGGWVADLDRETRGHARGVDWNVWLRRGVSVVSLRRKGRPEAVGALTMTAKSAAIGPIEGRTPAAAAEILPLLLTEARRLGALSATLTVPADAAALLGAALKARFRLESSFPLLASRLRGDFRRYAASATAFF